MISQSYLCAQPKSVGATFSFTGFAISYEHDLGQQGSFVETSLKAETSEIFLYREAWPGISGSVTWNLPFKELLSVNGNKVTFFAGPGIIAGYGPDFERTYGAFFGLKGRVGVECNFDRKVVISAFVSPVIGSHMEFHRDYLVMRYYRNGLAYSIIPEIGIKYRF